MAKTRSYRLLCPIARALDRIGDRWTLLLLRDLHAGPARFGEIAAGLPGLATNLLTTRLEKMQADGLIRRRSAEHGVVVYELTEEGERTAPVLFELARFAGPMPEERRKPGHLRLMVVTVKEALRRAGSDASWHVEMFVDGEPFAIDVEGAQVQVRYAAHPEAPLSFAIDYEALMELTDGKMNPREFSARHLRVSRGTKRAAGALLGLVARGLH